MPRWISKFWNPENQTTPYSRARLRERVCVVTETRSASPGSTSGASATSASRNSLIDFSSLAQTAFRQRLNVTMKTSVRITLAKLAKVKGQLYQKHSAQQKKEVVTTGAGTTGYPK